MRSAPSRHPAHARARGISLEGAAATALRIVATLPARNAAHSLPERCICAASMTAPSAGTSMARRDGSHDYDIAFYCPWAGPLLTTGPVVTAGGAETQMILISRALARAGHRVAIIVYETDVPLSARVDQVDVVVQRRFTTGSKLLRAGANA